MSPPASGRPALIVTGEESTAQVRLRAERIGALHPGLFLAAENDLGALLTHIEQVDPGLLVVDSIQTITTTAIDSGAGGVTQIRATAAALINVAKQRGLATILVGHVTKDGTVAGPRALEHLVDVVLYFEGDRHSSLRLIRSTKNRYGTVDEIGCFEMREDGIVGLADPSGLFLSDRPVGVRGTCVGVVLEGRRPLVTEIQAMVSRSMSGGSAAPVAVGTGRVAGGDAARRARPALFGRPLRLRRVRLDRRRDRRDRAGGRPGDRAGAGLRPARRRPVARAVRDRRGVAVG